jgi:hypothetical protein
MRYWKTHQKKLIKSYLNVTMEHKYKLTVWQQFGNSRKQYKAELTEYDPTRCKVKIQAESMRKNGPLEKEHPAYFHIQELDVIFSKNQYTYFNEIIDFPPPGEVQVYEKRNKQRFYYKYQDHKNITFYSESNKIHTNENGEIEPDYLYSCVLVDISIHGAGLVVPKQVVDKIGNDRVIFLQDITDQKLPLNFKTEIKYIKKYDELDTGDAYKVGIHFADELDNVSYKSITSIVEIKQKKTRGLTPDRFCGLDYEDQVSTLNKIEFTNKTLAANIKDNIDFLDRLRYMTTQMKIEFLQSVEHDLLANALRLSSKELIYDLLIELTSNMQEEFLDKLAQEKPASGICKAQDKICAFIREKEGKGEYILDPTSFTTYV